MIDTNIIISILTSSEKVDQAKSVFKSLAASCRYHGIKKIATFDADFKRVDFLDIVEA